MNPVPLLITHDLELAPDHDPDGQRRILDVLAQRLAAAGLPTTVFATAAAAEQFRSEVRAFALGGHEIACHGVNHGRDENLRRAGADHAAAIIREATTRISSATGQVPRCFRGPFSSTSAAAQRTLVELGYHADFSVCPGRIDFLLTRGGTAGWLRAPRTAYRPSAASPYRRGEVPLWVVPLSARGLPFLSGVLYLMGPAFTKRLFDTLQRESLRTGSPVVFLFHSYEFTEPCQRPRGSTVPRKRVHRLYERDRRVRLDNMFRLFDHMRNAGATALTGSDYISRYCSPRNEAITCTSS